MEFRILGPLEVVDGARELTPRRAKQRTLLAMLLLHADEPVAREVLLEALWGEHPPPTAQTALHGHVSALRKLLGGDRISTRAPGYQVCLRPGELDADRFEALVRQAGASDDPAERSQRLREALELWRGEPLADFRYEEFAQAQITQLRERRLAAIEDRAECELARGRHQEVLGELEPLLAEQPLRERLRALLMLALYRAGRQGDALNVYAEGRRLLAEELGLDPGPTLQALQQRILQHDPGLVPPPPKASPPRQERKHVTVMVAELTPVRPTDPEELERLIGPALARARDLVGGFGGTAQPLFSNALIGVFGAPRAHEDDVERALRAAAALVNVVREDGRLTVRVGIERGEALVTIDGDRVDVTGDVISAASRLQASAPRDGVMLGPALKRTSRPEPGQGETPFVGRRGELELLQRSYERSVSESAVALVTVVGEPGSGKTRLANEFRTWLEGRGPHRWLEGHCLPYGEGVTFWAVGEIVKAQTGILESDDPETSARKLGAAVAAVLSEREDRAWVQASLAPLVGVASSATAKREQSFAAWRRFLEALAWREPLVLLIEDLHWGDRALLEFVDDLVARAEGVPLVVLCTARLELLDTEPRWSGGKRNTSTITLSPLSEQETREVARTVLDGREPSGALVARAGGNPLFAQELARMQAADLTSVPASLDAVIAARLDTLAPDVKQAAMDAGVIGEVFWPGALTAIGEVDERELEDRLRRLVASDFVRRARTSSVEGQREYAFVHALVRDVAYGQIPKAKRARKHQAAAAWIEQLAGARVIDHAELIAHHYGAALELARAAGEDARELATKTSEFLVLAGDRAMPLDIASAEQFYRRAVALLDHADPRRIRVLLALARTAQESGRLEEAISGYEDAIAKLRARDDPVMLGQALVYYEEAIWKHGRSKQRGKPLAEAIELLECEPPGVELADAYTKMAYEHVLAGDASGSLEWSEKALALASDLGLERVRVRALQWRGFGRFGLGDLAGVDDLREALQRGLAAGLGIETGYAYVNLAELVSWSDGPQPSLRLGDQGIDFSERRGLKHNAYWLRMEKLPRLFDAGRWDELLALAGDILAWEQSHGETQITTAVVVQSAGVQLLRGHVREARSRIDRALAAAREVNDPQLLAPALVLAALINQAYGTDQAAIERLEEFESATSVRASIYRALWIADVARVCAATGPIALANRLVSDLNVVAPRHAHGLATAHAVIAEAEQRLEQAIVGYSEAARRWRGFGNVVEHGYALLGLGRCLNRVERHADAVEPLEAARRIFRALRARPLVDEVDVHLARAAPEPH